MNRRGFAPAVGGRTARRRAQWKDRDPVPTTTARRARVVLLALSVAVGLLGLVARCAWLQIYKASDLLEQARSQQEQTITLDPLRGAIVDRNGKDLAVSLDVDSVFAEPSAIEDPGAVARKLEPILGLRAAELRERLAGGRHFAWLKRKVTPDLRRKVEALHLAGIGFVRESRRYYPKRALAAHVLGACGVDNQGLDGLEFLYDRAIQGTPGRILALRDGRGGRVFDRSRVDPIVGDGLALTIDEVIQYAAERELDAVMQDTGADGATVVVLRPRTGEVLALASRPTFDPNNYPAADDAARRDRAVTDYYEPGSTFKVVTAAAALDRGRVHPNEVIWCENGSIQIANHLYKEDRRPYGNLTFTDVLAKSSNVGAIKIGRRLRPDEFMATIRGFGFGSKTGIDLPGESPGLLRDVPQWSGLSQASLSMGQEIGSTPVQLAAMLAAVANDGVWVRPYVVQATIAPDGRRAPRPRGPDDERPVISAATARALRKALQSVTIDGTAKAAALPGYSVGGKTGTAQKIDATGRYARGRYVSWFAGFVPADAPALAIVVMVDEPKGPKYHGGDIAAPVFARVALPALQYLGVPPDRQGPLVFDRTVVAERDARAAVAPDRDRRPVTQPASVVPAVRRGAGAGRDADVLRASLGALPARLAPAAGRSAMPDLTEMSMRQASEALAAARLTCRNKVSGPRVTRQEPPPGTEIGPGAACLVVY
jgi:cell division protein FtsI (penicillin-binding protein 3)